MKKTGKKDVKGQRAKASSKKASTTDLPVKDATGVKGGTTSKDKYLVMTMDNTLISSI